MERILKLIYGYIMILVKGEQLERFLNLWQVHLWQQFRSSLYS